MLPAVKLAKMLIQWQRAQDWHLLRPWLFCLLPSSVSALYDFWVHDCKGQCCFITRQLFWASSHILHMLETLSFFPEPASGHSIFACCTSRSAVKKTTRTIQLSSKERTRWFLIGQCQHQPTARSKTILQRYCLPVYAIMVSRSPYFVQRHFPRWTVSLSSSLLYRFFAFLAAKQHPVILLW